MYTLTYKYTHTHTHTHTHKHTHTQFCGHLPNTNIFQHTRFAVTHPTPFHEYDTIAAVAEPKAEVF